MKRVDMAGLRFGRLVVLAYLGSSGVGARWKCVCDCGNTTEVYRNNLVRGQVKSCGCLRREVANSDLRKNPDRQHPLYATWRNIHSRCSNPKSPAYPSYGGRGITVCDRWNTFTNFAADMGPKPKGKSIDRVDNDGPYSPENCRWATQKEQMGNTRKTPRFEGKTLKEWEVELGVKYHTLFYRLKKHGSVFLPDEGGEDG